MTAGFDEKQSLALAIVPKFTGFLGVVFSLLIVITVARDSKKRNKTYHRLLVGISLTDISSSFWLGLSTWPIPADATVLWAVGNDKTCNLQGFFTQFGISSSFYNASLSLYFLLVIRYGWKESRIERIEPFLHAVPLLWGFGTAFSGLGLGIFGNATLWCWIAKKYDVYRWAFFYGPLWTMIFLVTASSIMIYHYVHKLEERTKQYKYQFNAKQDEQNKWSSSASSFDFGQKSATSDSPLDLVNSAALKPTLDESSESKPAEDGGEVERGERIVKNEQPAYGEVNSEEHGPSAETLATNVKVRPKPSCKFEEESNRKMAQEDTSAALNPPAPRKSLLQSLAMRLSARGNASKAAAAHRRRTREVASQCFWFAGAFYINWIALSLTRLLQTINGKVYFPLLILAAITTPLQGLPNVIVYLGPKFRKLRQRWPNASLWRLFKASLARERPGLPVMLSITEDSQ